LPSPHSVGVNPNMKGVAVRAVKRRWVRRGTRTRIGVRVPGGYSGIATISVGRRRFCATVIRGGAGGCVGRAVLPGRRPLTVIFRGTGTDRGVTGSALSTLLTRPRTRVSTRDVCAVGGPVGIRIRTLSAAQCGGNR
jgi:hypothetical protein